MIARYLGYYSHKSKRTYTDQLRKKEFTDEVLQLLGISPEEYRTIRTFSAVQSQKIRDLFDIQPTDLT